MKSSIGVLFVVLLAAGCAAPDAPEPDRVVAVRTSVAATSDVEVAVEAPATVFARSEAKVAARLTAPVERLEVRKGDRVRRGQVLARLVRDDLDAQRAEAAAQVADGKANLEKVSAGTVPAEVERARGEVEATAAALAEAETIYRRRQTLFTEGAIPERELLLSKTSYEQAQTAHRVAKSSLDLLLTGSRQQDVRMAESRLQQAEARLAYVEAQLGYAEIRSPFDGTVTEQFLYPGDMTKPDTPIFTVMDLSTVVARGQFSSDRSAEVRNGQACSFESIDSPGLRFRGAVTVVNQAVDLTRRTVEVWCDIPNREGRLKAGTFGKVAVVTATHAEAVTVPVTAVQFEEGKKEGICWQVGSDGIVHGRRVTTGVLSEGRVEILEGLRPGETVVMEGGYGLTEGATVSARTAASPEPPQ